ncbi:hypothetical protein MKW92_027775 [Papaver armeniacum]|nr:hypothetical protein MKW92_027775 [Papaver armeniacum]
MALLCAGSGVVLASDEKTTYCVAKPFGVDENVLLAALNWACGKVDCSPLLQGQICYEPDTVSAHASYAFNQYYQQSGRLTGTCDFNGVAMVTTTDPSHGNCTFSRQTPTASPGSTLHVSGTSVLMVVMSLNLFL